MLWNSFFWPAISELFFLDCYFWSLITEKKYSLWNTIILFSSRTRWQNQKDLETAFSSCQSANRQKSAPVFLYLSILQTCLCLGKELITLEYKMLWFGICCINSWEKNPFPDASLSEERNIRNGKIYTSPRLSPVVSAQIRAFSQL